MKGSDLGGQFGDKGTRVNGDFLMKTLGIAVKGRGDLTKDDDITLDQIGMQGNWGYVKAVTGSDSLFLGRTVESPSSDGNKSVVRAFVGT